MGNDALILFDGECSLCSGAARFVARRDPRGRFRFASLRSEAGRRACERLGVQVPAGEPDSIVLATEHRTWVRSDAVLQIARRLPWPWRSASVLRVIPARVRDAAYRWVARNRYRWFGRADRCLAPTPELRERMLD